MDEERSDAVSEVVKKGLALLVGMAVVIAVGTFVLVHALGLNDARANGSEVGPIQPASPLPSTALAVPGQANPTQDRSSEESDGPSKTASGSPPRRRAGRALRLSATPAQVSPMGRINLTGTYGRKDNVSLQIQRWENGAWADFPISVTVSVGTFATYIQTSHPGVNRFRVFDSGANLGSNVVRVEVG